MYAKRTDLNVNIKKDRMLLIINFLYGQQWSRFFFENKNGYLEGKAVSKYKTVMINLYSLEELNAIVKL